MKFEVKSELQYSVFLESSLLLNINAYTDENHKIINENFTTNPQVVVTELMPPGIQSRLMAVDVLPCPNFNISYKATVDNAYTIKDFDNVPKKNIYKLPVDVLTYLNPSRYCQSDKLYRFAFDNFGNEENDYRKVVAVTEWINKNIQYLSGSTNAQTSAYDTITEHAGVCRDFAHLGIALCRALSIPARYFTGYAYQLVPADFHACFEAYINGDWVLFDATKLIPLNGLVKIATGRDAADVSVASIFGNVGFVSSIVSCEFIGDHFEPFIFDANNNKGVCYL